VTAVVEPVAARATSAALPGWADYAEAWEIGRRHGSRMKFFAPSLKRFETPEWSPVRAPRFAAISLTGADCALQCNHCKAKVLETMHAARRPAELWELAQRLHAAGSRGALVTGGSARNGVVPFLPHLGVLRRIKQELGWRLVVHSGVADDRLVEGFAHVGVDAALVDVPPSTAAVREVLNLSLTPDDFLRMIDRLVAAGVRVTPHVVLGMHAGRIDGEARTLEHLRDCAIAALILVVLIPLPGTPMQTVQPPSPEALAPLFVQARRQFAGIPVVLGCARPGGRHKVMTDRVAIMAGFNGIAYPANGVVTLAAELGLEPELHEVCCSLYDLEV
jgi:lipoyl synthase